MYAHALTCRHVSLLLVTFSSHLFSRNLVFNVGQSLTRSFDLASFYSSSLRLRRVSAITTGEMAQDIRGAVAVEEPISRRSSNLSNFDAKQSVDGRGQSQNAHAESSPDDEYPQGIKFFVLAGATLSSVFLSALDQASIILRTCHDMTNKPDTSHSDHCRHRNSKDHGRVPRNQ